MMLNSRRCCCVEPNCSTTDNITTGFLDTPYTVNFTLIDAKGSFPFGNIRFFPFNGSMDLQEIQVAFTRVNGDVNTLRVFFATTGAEYFGDFCAGAGDPIRHLKAELDGDSVASPVEVCLTPFGTSVEPTYFASMATSFRVVVSNGNAIKLLVAGEWSIDQYTSGAQTERQFDFFDDVESVTVSGTSGAETLSEATVNAHIDQADKTNRYNPGDCAPYQPDITNLCCLKTIGGACLPSTVPQVTLTGVVQSCDNDIIGQGDWTLTDEPADSQPWPLQGSSSGWFAANRITTHPTVILYTDAIPAKGIPSYPVAFSVITSVSVAFHIQKYAISLGYLCVEDDSWLSLPQIERDRWMATEIEFSASILTRVKFNSDSTSSNQQWSYRMGSSIAASLGAWPISKEISLNSGWPITESKSLSSENTGGINPPFQVNQNYPGDCSKLKYDVVVSDLETGFRQVTMEVFHGGFSSTTPQVLIEL